MSDALQRLRAADPAPAPRTPSIDEVWRRIAAQHDSPLLESRAPVRQRRPAGAVMILAAVTVALLVAAVAIVVPGRSPTRPQHSEAPSRHATGPTPRSRAFLYGGEPQLRERLHGLRRLHVPVVVVLWASWCPPCWESLAVATRAQRSAAIPAAFVGVDVNDQPAAARRYLEQHPVSFASYTATRTQLSTLGIGYQEGLPVRDLPFGVTLTHGLPIVVLIDSNGYRRTLHEGPYATVQALSRDVRTILTR